jgi:hypothetical protein
MHEDADISSPFLRLLTHTQSDRWAEGHRGWLHLQAPSHHPTCSDQIIADMCGRLSPSSTKISGVLTTALQNLPVITMRGECIVSTGKKRKCRSQYSILRYPPQKSRSVLPVPLSSHAHLDLRFLSRPLYVCQSARTRLMRRRMTDTVDHDFINYEKLRGPFVG